MEMFRPLFWESKKKSKQRKKPNQNKNQLWFVPQHVQQMAQNFWSFFFFPASHSNISNFTKYNYSQCGRAEEGSRLQLFKGNKDSSFFCMCVGLSLFLSLVLMQSSNTAISRQKETGFQRPALILKE